MIFFVSGLHLLASGVWESVCTNIRVKLVVHECHFISFVLRRYIRLGKKFKDHFSQSFLPFKQSVFHAMPLTPFFEKQ